MFIINNVKTDSFSISTNSIVVNKGEFLKDANNDSLPGVKYLVVSHIAETQNNLVYGVENIYDPQSILVKINDEPFGMIYWMNVNNTTRKTTIKRHYVCFDIKQYLDKTIKISINDTQVCSGRIIEYNQRRIFPEGYLAEEIVIYNDDIT